VFLSQYDPMVESHGGPVSLLAKEAALLAKEAAKPPIEHAPQTSAQKDTKMHLFLY